MMETDPSNQWYAPIIYAVWEHCVTIEANRRAEVNASLDGCDFKLAVRPEAILRDCMRSMTFIAVPAGNA